MTSTDTHRRTALERLGRSAIIFAEWDTAADAPVVNGKCIEVASVAMSFSWGPVGGCSGAECSSASSCCGVAPFCIPATSTRAFCSSACSASAGNCEATTDCCAGFKCFLGACMDNTCIGKTCAAGFEVGGCRANAPYCTGDAGGLKCRIACGDRNARCAADADCCTGTRCSSGTCQ